MSRWNHGHSLAAGVAGGLLLAQHVVVIGAACFVGGLLAGRFWSVLAWVAAALREAIGAWLGRAHHGHLGRGVVRSSRD